MAQQHDHGESANHDCCEADGSDPRQGCEHQLQCGFCTAGVLGFTVIPAAVSMLPPVRNDVFSSGALTPSHSSPPYRPPIS